MSQEEVTGLGLRCQRCGQPLDVTPESIVVVCKYCGWPNWTVQALSYPIVIIPAPSKGLDRYFYWYVRVDPDMHKIQDKVTLKRIGLFYIPVYSAWTRVWGKAWGKANVLLTKVVVRREDGRTETKVVRREIIVDVSHTYDMRDTIDIVARRSYERQTVDPLVEYYAKKGRPFQALGRPIQQVNWEEVRGDVLAAEIGPDEAASYAKDEACDRAYHVVKKTMETKAKEKAVLMAPEGFVPVSVTWLELRIPCRSEVTSLSPIVLLPLVEAVYSYEGKIYRTVFAGWDGTRVYGEEPVFAHTRLMSFGAGALLAGLLGGGGVSAILLAGDLTMQAAGALGVLAGMAGSYYLAKESLKDVRVEKGV